jgi:catechol 2,3-dioxygenase-like lactoylglutathione lyase family enzyme
MPKPFIMCVLTNRKRPEKMMVSGIDRIVLAVPELAVAVEEYGQLLGARAWTVLTAGGAAAAWLGLDNTVLELVEAEVERAVIEGVVLCSADAGVAPEPIANGLQLAVTCCDGSATANFRREHAGAQSDRMRVDHLVLRTADAAGCIALFTEHLGIRLALDKTVPEWGGRMLFFRVGGLTLEVIEAHQDKPTRDRFWGIAYQCPDIELALDQMQRRGVSLSGVRDGRKSGTRVATVKSASLGIPTLLIEPAK